MNSGQFWKERFVSYSKEMQRYLRYIFNGHLVFVMVIAFGGAAYYYSNWVKTLHSDFPAVPIMAVILALLVTRSPIHTFLREADTVFILPVETQLKPYFTRSILLSWFLQSYMLLLVLAALMPMYAKVTGSGMNDFVTVLIVLLLVKMINLNSQWYVLKYQEVSTSRIDLLLRFVINVVLLYVVLDKASIWVSVLILCILLGLFAYYRGATRQKALQWERLVALESKRLQAFYRLANLFTDVPSLGSKVARRKWLDFLLSFIPYKQSSTYMYLYGRTFLRANDYAGLLVRLTLIGSVILAVLSNQWAYLFVVVLFLFITAIQLLPVWKVHEWKIWVSLYPLPANMREAAVIRWISYFLSLEAVIFIVVLLCKGEWMSAGLALFVGIVFIVGFKSYAVKKIRTF
ncbi:ABC transporter permease [Peribacillus asahii]|uniref:ABC transporter permease n=1 Tax=Peribacillus asahii TaxID=228899 RepID=UPI0037F3196D